MADSLPEVGSAAPTFSALDQSGEPVSLAAFRGDRHLVLFFYPKADTPGWTIEARGFRDAHDAFSAAGTEVIGISPDPVTKLARFADKHGLGLTLLSDEDHAIAEAYGVWKEKTFMGRKYMGIERTSFLVDREGVLRQIFQKFDLGAHPAEVLEAVRSLD